GAGARRERGRGPEAPRVERRVSAPPHRGNTRPARPGQRGGGGEKEGGSRQWHQRYGRFQRSIPLSTAVNADQVEARYHNGVLEVHLPRTEPSPGRRIEVKT